MRKTITLLLAAFFFASTAFANTNNVYKIHGTQWHLGTVATDKLSNVSIEITPKGLYAQVEMTFVMECNNLHFMIGSFPNQQGVLNFELPPNSYIYDSWLWFDNTTILKAHIIDRGKAQAIYNGIVSRSCDPSLLEKTGENMYQLHVFPMNTYFPRKVKISYCTQLTFRDNEAFVTLPTDLFCGSDVKPSLGVRINKTTAYSSPTILEADYNSMLQQNDPDHDSLVITPDKYSFSRELNLRYNVANTTQFNYFPLNADKGVYELMVPAENTAAPKHFVFALDANNTSVSHGTMGEMKKNLRTFLLTNCRPIDSFNIYYLDGGVQQSFSGWGPANITTVLAALDAIPETITEADSLLPNMLISSYQQCQQKPVQDVQYVLMSGNYSFGNSVLSQSVVQDVIAGVGGLTHKLNAISLYGQPYIATLTQNSGGRLSEIKGTHFNEWAFDNSYDISPKSELKRLLYDLYESTPYCDLTLPTSTGLVIQREKLMPKRQYYPGQPYMEAGVYYGQFTGSDVTFEYLGQNSVLSRTENMGSFIAGDSMIKKDWMNSYIVKLEEANPTSYHQQIRDSSINNRVLSTATAFLALEPQDTMLLTGNPSWWSWPLQLSASNITGNSDIVAYPNPFSSEIILESTEIMEEITIYDMTGRIVFVIRPETKRFVWGGKDTGNKTLSGGTYIVKVTSGGKAHHFKINKL